MASKSSLISFLGAELPRTPVTQTEFDCTPFENLEFSDQLKTYEKLHQIIIKRQKQEVRKMAQELKDIAHSDWFLLINQHGEIHITYKRGQSTTYPEADTGTLCFYLGYVEIQDQQRYEKRMYFYVNYLKHDETITFEQFQRKDIYSEYTQHKKYLSLERDLAKKILAAPPKEAMDILKATDKSEQ